jgi:beta-lactamase regulating signal transducer with metallopeptidase domain
MSVDLTALGGVRAITQAATGGLLTAIWQGALLAASAGLGLRLVPKTPAAARFAIWFAVFAVVVALPVLALWPHGADVAQASGHSAWLTLDERWSLAIAAVWGLASLVRAVTLAVAGFRVRALWRRAEPVEIEIPQTESRSAQVCVSDEVDRPSVIGFFAPRILIPRCLLERLTPAELEQIVLHEAGHLGRADDWLNLMQKIALVVFPLNPALAWVERRLCFERELACDERVLRTTGAPKAYAACLAALAEHRMTRPTMALSLGALGRESELGQRVGRILRFGEWMRPVQARAVMGVAMLGLLGGATELARCPQVIGFSADHPRASQVAASVAPVRAANGLGYQAVVLRPDEARATMRPVPTHHDGAVMNVAPSVAAGRQATHREVAVKDETPNGSSGVTNRNFDAREAQWLVVTSWSGMDGSRVVLTAMTLPNAAEASARGSEDDAPNAAAGPAAEGQPQQDVPQQVHRYAAVPVRGGWLVFQL